MNIEKLNKIITDSRQLLERYEQPYSSTSPSMEDPTFVEIKNSIVAAELSKGGEIPFKLDKNNPNDMQLLRALNRISEQLQANNQETLPSKESSIVALESLDQPKIKPSQRLLDLRNSVSRL